MFEMRFYPEGIDWIYYQVEQKSKRFYGISKVKYEGHNKEFITHRENSRQACNLAGLLAKTYGNGYYDAQG